MLLTERKAALRLTERKRRLLGTPEEEFARHSDAAQANFLKAFPPLAGRKIALYSSLRGEVGTDRIRGAALSAGAFLYYPKVMGEGILSFFPHGEEDGWVTGKYGLKEPFAPPGSPGVRKGFDLVAVPGVAFDGKGGRLGQGYGYYDRFLAGLDAATLIVGLAFSRQLVREVPVEEWDVPVDAVVTEKGILAISRKAAGGVGKK